MRKHVIGFVLFASIISLFVAGFFLFRLTSIPEIGSVEHPVLQSETSFDSAHIRIVQAIADPLEKKVTLDLSIDRLDGKSADVPGDVHAVFTFYAVAGDDIRLISSEEVEILPDFRPTGSAEGIVRYKFNWLANMKTSDNLYVMAKVWRSENDKSLVAFSKDRATAVLINKK